MNAKFEKQRFVQLLKWDLVTERKDYVRFAVAMTLVLSFVFLMSILGMLESRIGGRPADLQQMYFDNAMFAMTTTAQAISFAVMFSVATYIFRNMQTKQQRITFLMMPSSNLEKYLVRFLHVTVGYFVCFWLAFFIADIVQFVFSLVVVRGPHGFVTSYMLHTAFAHKTALINGMFIDGNMFTLMSWQEMVGLSTLVAATHAFCIFCGALFRRNPWLLTLGSMFAIFFLWVFFVEICFDVNSLSRWVLHDDGNIMFWIFETLGLAVAVSAYCGSYRLFCRMQVVNNKWLNV